MKKILLFFSNYSIPGNAANYAVQLAKACNATLVGLFVNELPPVSGESHGPSDLIENSYADRVKEANEEESKRLQDSLINLFENKCKAENISYQVKKMRGDHLDTLTDATEFADIFLIEEKSDVGNLSVNRLLSGSNCPVMIIPPDFKTIETVIFAYDDNFPGMYAIKLFSYLFPGPQTSVVRLVSVVPENILGIEYRDELESWIRLHYPGAGFEIIKGVAEDVLPEYINKYPGALVVMAAFGRTTLSLLFRESMAHVVMNKTNAALFIAHK